MRPIRTKPSWALPIFLVACTWVSVLSTDLYAPSLPHLPRLLGTTEQAAKLTISVNLAAFALAQLAHGPLADRFGRRTMLVAGIAMFALASALCALAPSVATLIGGRALQGLFSSVPSVVVLLLVHETYGRDRSVRILGFHGMAVGIAPILGPLIGGIVFVHFGWRANFWLLAGFAAAIAAIVYRNVPETLEQAVPLHPRMMMRNYRAVLMRRAALAHLLPLASIYGALFAFITGGPFLLIDRYGVATERYGLFFGTVVLAAVIGGMIANRLGGVVSGERLEASAILLSASGIAAAAFANMAMIDSALSLTASMAIFGVGFGLINASAPILLLESVDDRLRRSASAIAGSAQLIAASGASFLVAGVHSDTLKPMLLVMSGLVTAGVFGIVIGGAGNAAARSP